MHQHVAKAVTDFTWYDGASAKASLSSSRAVASAIQKSVQSFLYLNISLHLKIQAIRRQCCSYRASRFAFHLLKLDNTCVVQI